jgi:hypothetical protein
VKNKKNLPVYILLIILLGGFLVRLYGFTNPIADWHSWRQADTSAVSRNFVNRGYDVLHPRYDDISNVQTGVDNPEGYRFVEFPLYNIFQAGLFQLFGVLTIEEWGRIVTILASVLTGLFLYLLISRHSNKPLGLLSTFFYMFIPYNIYYGRTILPDTTMMTAVIGGIYFFDKWVELSSKSKLKTRSYIYFILAILFTAASCLLKPYAVFFILPMVIIAFQEWHWGIWKIWQLWVFGMLALAPIVGWRVWIMQYPEGVPVNLWLLNGNGIRFRPAFFRWIVYERLTKLIAGYLGIIVLVYGVFKVWTHKEKWFFLSFLLSSLLYVMIFATGNVQHDYYQILIMPSVSIFFALGSYYLYQWLFKKLPLGRIILVISLAGMFWFGWQQVKDYFNINNRSIIAAGEAVDRLTPKDAKVIANLNGDTTLLYHTKRKGWPSFQADIPILIEKGAGYLVLLNPTEADMVIAKSYKVLEKTPQYVIFDLKNKK